MIMKKLNITFCSFPDYDSNAKALYEYMKETYQGKMNFVWIVNEEDMVGVLKEKGIRAILMGTEEFKEYIKTTDVFFTTHANLTGDKTEDSLYVELWHGISSKKLGFMINNISKHDLEWFQQLSEVLDYIIVPSEFWAVIFANRFHVDLKQILPIGYPKLHMIERKNAKKNLSKVIHEEVEAYDKIIFYTPTFRTGCGRNTEVGFGNNILNLKPYQEKELSEYLEKHNYLLCLKLHPSEESDFLKDFQDQKYIKLLKQDQIKKEGFVLYDFLDAADILITDYSSLGIEFLYLDKPVIYLNTDEKEYMESRGICYNNFDFWTSSNGVSTLPEVLKKIDEYQALKQLPKELQEKKKLWFDHIEDGGCKAICDYFFTKEGKLRSSVKPVVNANRRAKQLLEQVSFYEEKSKHYQELYEQKEQELQAMIHSKGWQMLEKMRKIKNKIHK